MAGQARKPLRAPNSRHTVLSRRITRLIGEIQRDPFKGIGKPEPFKGELSGYWSRRIDDEHRLVYRADEDEVKVLKARYHY
ncbi:toxin RelK [Mycobacterium branderi]|uniref:Endoribonuclease YoeB n=1 Tax=Mycobacterium branderi TaxID=43348 RepID=A0AA91RFL9_9MYCO|nr:Txe/YoeB family addiction module toxin [Mycobacterium branderi]ORA31821.1 toxin RelK [Mycobacterium branderi]